jgi:hypothetical protein
MRSNNGLLSLSLSILIVLANTTLTAQIRRNDGAHHGSFYLSAGKNVSSFGRSDIHIEQKSLGNNYDMMQVKADNKGTGLSIFPWNLNYRLGYYFDYDQTMGIELSYDPVNFHITDGELIPVQGTINDVPNTSKAIAFSSKDGYYYSLSGANLLLANFVKRYTLFRPITNKIAIDGIAKVGAGPLMPRCESTMPYNGYPIHSFDDHQFQFRGFNTALEGALRFTFFRFIYLEAAAKYDYAMYKGMNIYKGTASQNLSTTEVIASLGFTFPTNKFNPLFYHPRKVITITSLAEAKKQQAAEALEEKENGGKKKKKKSKGEEEAIEIPEFQNVIERTEKKEAPPAEDTVNKENQPNPEAPVNPDSTATVNPDSTANKEQTEEPKKKKKKRKHKKDEENAEAPAPVTPPAEAAPTPTPTPTPEPTPTPTPTPTPEPTPAPAPEPAPENKEKGAETANPDNMSKKERKALEKAKKEQEKKEREEQQRIEKEKKAEEKKTEQEKKEQDRLEQEKKDKEEADKKKAEDEKAAATSAEEDKKAQKQKELEDKKAQREKEMQELKEKREKEMEEIKAKREKEKAEREEKAEQAKKEREEKLEQAKKEREEKLEQAKKEREEKLEQMKKEREEQLEKARKEREEQLEKARKEKEEQDKAK